MLNCSLSCSWSVPHHPRAIISCFPCIPVSLFYCFIDLCQWYHIDQKLFGFNSHKVTVWSCFQNQRFGSSKYLCRWKYALSISNLVRRPWQKFFWLRINFFIRFSNWVRSYHLPPFWFSNQVSSWLVLAQPISMAKLIVPIS